MVITLNRTQNKGTNSGNESTRVDEFKKRMLQWSNPVEFVNNMYSSHPGDEFTEYFVEVFGE
ncbi:MAG: hypothetical protein NT018_05915 [Armatimonadetes bacterium]|nr:hypothetical protein [Armatimonadota bacterium]